MSCDTIYITTYNRLDLFNNFNITYGCNRNFYNIVEELKSSYYIITDRMASNLHYGIISCNVKEDTFITIDSRRTKLYESRVGFLEFYYDI